MKVITVLNEKGGVGKTTLVNTLGSGLAIRGYTVVVVDADPQGNLTLGLGVEPSPGFYDLLVRDREFRHILRPLSPEVWSPPDSTGQGRLLLVPGNQETRNIAQNVNSALIVEERFAELESSVDVVIFDTSPTPSLLHASIYLATDGLVLPTELEYYSFNGLINSIDHSQGYSRDRVRLSGQSIAVAGVVPTKVRMKTLEHQENLEALRKRYGDLIWPPMPMRIIWSEAPMRKQTIFSYAPESAAARDAWRIVDRLEGVVNHVE